MRRQTPTTSADEARESPSRLIKGGAPVTAPPTRTACTSQGRKVRHTKRKMMISYFYENPMQMIDKRGGKALEQKRRGHQDDHGDLPSRLRKGDSEPNELDRGKVSLGRAREHSVLSRMLRGIIALRAAKATGSTSRRVTRKG